MTVYAIARSLYHATDRVLIRHLPGHDRVQACLWRIARRLFPDRIKARSASEFAPLAERRAAAPSRLPAWAEPEVAELSRYEPLLAKLVGADAVVEPYFIPWDMNYVGRRYADARRQLTGHYACLVLSGAGGEAVDMPMLCSVPRPLAVIDVVGDARLAALVRAAGADYVALPAEHLDANDHCAVLARLVLQLAPDELLPTPNPVVVRCLERHGRALATVSKLRPLPAHPRTNAMPAGMAP